MVVDYRRKQQNYSYTPLMISGQPVERVTSFKYLGVHITEDLTWTVNTQYVLKKSRQRLYFLRQLRKFKVSTSIMKAFYTSAVESVLTGSIITWNFSKTSPTKNACFIVLTGIRINFETNTGDNVSATLVLR
ncbi:hypothetical protein AALO_G00270430 [Alosa alosa]|uniref:Alkylated DNA repair protein AlkB homologue 8 N-terminal domain-containing protein n=1 Tax=Alosa alosa TaxID=278164 RepID=A0AAV6FML0_9TELE|nr:hypothetical protein AALO_G00270430 [Alosa alosa]